MFSLLDSILERANGGAQVHFLRAILTENAWLSDTRILELFLKAYTYILLHAVEYTKFINIDLTYINQGNISHICFQNTSVMIRLQMI